MNPPIAKKIGEIFISFCLSVFVLHIPYLLLVAWQGKSDTTVTVMQIAGAVLCFIGFLACPKLSAATVNTALLVCIGLPFCCKHLYKFFLLIFVGTNPYLVLEARIAYRDFYMSGAACAILFYFLLFPIWKAHRKNGKLPRSTRILATVLCSFAVLYALEPLASTVAYLCTFGYTPMRIFGIIAASGMLLLFLGVLLKIHLPERSNHAKSTRNT